MPVPVKIAAVALLATAVVPADGAGTVAALPAVSCTASGSKFLVPAMTDAQACARFVESLAAARGTATRRATPNDRLTVELQFGKAGVASAHVTLLRARHTKTLPVYQLAISDRHLAATDIDILARTVAGGTARGLN